MPAAPEVAAGAFRAVAGRSDRDGYQGSGQKEWGQMKTRKCQQCGRVGKFFSVHAEICKRCASANVRTWYEDNDPRTLAVAMLKKRGIQASPRLVEFMAGLVGDKSNIRRIEGELNGIIRAGDQ